MKQRKWLILTALAMEANAIAGKFGLKKISMTDPNPLPGVDADLQVIGIRAIHLNTELCKRYSTGVILAGLAGALDPSLKIGQVIIDHVPLLPPRPVPWPELPYRQIKIHTANQVICEVSEKAALFAQTGAGAVDMETAIVRRRAIDAGLPMLTIRAISDTAKDALPPEMLGWIDDYGRPQPMRVAKGLALRPDRIPALMRLGKHSKLACENMAAAVQSALRKSTST